MYYECIDYCWTLTALAWFELASTSQLSPFSPAHSSWRYTGTLWSHYHCLQDVFWSCSCNYIWWMSQPFAWPARWCSTKDSGDYCDGVWWVEHALHIALYCLWLEQYTISDVVCTKNQSSILYTQTADSHCHGNMFSYLTDEDMTLHNTMHLSASGWKSSLEACPFSSIWKYMLC